MAAHVITSNKNNPFEPTQAWHREIERKLMLANIDTLMYLIHFQSTVKGSEIKSTISQIYNQQSVSRSEMLKTQYKGILILFGKKSVTISLQCGKANGDVKAFDQSHIDIILGKDKVDDALPSDLARQIFASFELSLPLASGDLIDWSNQHVKEIKAHFQSKLAWREKLLLPCESLLTFFNVTPPSKSTETVIHSYSSLRSQVKIIIDAEKEAEKKIKADKNKQTEFYAECQNTMAGARKSLELTRAENKWLREELGMDADDSDIDMDTE